MLPLNERKKRENMFESLGSAIKQEQEKLAKKRRWLIKFLDLIQDKPVLSDPFVDDKLTHQIPTSISGVTQIAGVDGGIVSESMTGFDLALYRAVSAVFSGIGRKVESKYIPHFDPDPQIFFSPSLQSRMEFSRMCTLLRLYAEYEVAKMTIEKAHPAVIFLDGKATPLRSDFTVTNPSTLLKQAEDDVKRIYTELVELAFDKQVLIGGVIKDSRSREMTKSLGSILPLLTRKYKLDPTLMQQWPYMLDNFQDTSFGEIVLETGQRTAWLKSKTPTWLPKSLDAELRTCLVKPVAEDQPIRLELLLSKSERDMERVADIALGGLHILSNHGLPLALPTVILEADERAKLSGDHLDVVIDQISMTLGVPREHLRKRRFFSSGLSRL